MSNTDEEIVSFLTKFIKEDALYASLNFKDDHGFENPTDLNKNIIRLKYLKNFERHIDFFCPQCGENSVFKRIPRLSQREEFTTFSYDQSNPGSKTSAHIASLVFSCSRDKDHLFSVIFLIKMADCSTNHMVKDYEGELIKIGQYPTIADVENQKIKKYRKLPNDLYKELSKALGLYSHNVGIGSFVYLRRIFERLVDEAYDKAKNSGTFSLTEKEFNDKRMGERVSALRDFLPDRIVEVPSLYSILSAGIHSWTEESCKKHFPLLFIYICLILDEKIVQSEREELAAQSIKEINALMSSAKT